MRAGKLVVAVALAVLVGGACSSDDSDTQDDAERSTAPEISEPSTTEAAPSAPADPAAAEAEIRANFETVFDSNTPAADAFALAEDAAGIAPTLEQAQAASPGGHRTVAVTSVKFTGETTADVVFDIALEGNVLLPNFGGAAVFEDGVWKVSRKTNCDLAALAGFSCPS